MNPLGSPEGPLALLLAYRVTAGLQSCPYCCIPAPSVSHFLFVSLLLGKPYFRATCRRQRTQKQGSELDDICPDCSEKFLGQSFSWSMFSPSLAVSFSVSLCPSSPTLSPATTKVEGKTHIAYLGFVGFILVLPWGTRLIVSRQ